MFSFTFSGRTASDLGQKWYFFEKKSTKNFPTPIQFLFKLFCIKIKICIIFTKGTTSDCRAHKRSRLGSGHIAALPREKYSVFVHVISGYRGLLRMKQSQNHCYCEAISEATMKNLHEKLICYTKFFFNSWNFILGIFFKLPLCLAVIKLCFFTMRSTVQKSKNCKKAIGI